MLNILIQTDHAAIQETSFYLQDVWLQMIDQFDQ